VAAKTEAIVERVLYVPFFGGVRRHIQVNHRVKIVEVDGWRNGLVLQGKKTGN
jgi:phosphohistidine swiveling domain-containing protein